jgi:hypothetical protein
MSLLQQVRDTLRLLPHGGPGVCNIAVTNVCNAKCDFCNYARDKNFVNERVWIDYDKLCQAIDILYDRGIRYLTFSGGEPTFKSMQQLGTRLKPYLRWLIFGGILFFLGKAFKAHAAEVTAVRIHGGGWMYLAIALIVTLLAHALAGWVWSWILQGFKHPVSGPWAIQVYLKSNIAKYLPGSVWHYYGRISKVTEAGVPTATATVSVLIEPPLMSAAALLLVLVGSQLNQGLSQNFNLWNWQIFGLVGVLLLLHPWCLNPILRLVGKFKGKSKNTTVTDVADCKLEAYPASSGRNWLFGTPQFRVFTDVSGTYPSGIPSNSHALKCV